MTTAEQKAFARRWSGDEFTTLAIFQTAHRRQDDTAHHKVIQKTLDRVIDGEIQRPDYQCPPGYAEDRSWRPSI